jgi:two-component system response regulator|tara:strand:+ start:151 stop:606 length:456 start_codon:yes stop_codon:yes gene_type:complete
MNGKNVLIVEDDPDHAYLIIHILNENKLIFMEDGQEAIDYLLEADLSDREEYRDRDGGNGRQSRVDLIVLDINLSKINGMFVLKFLKNNSRYCTVPVIVLSTSYDKETIREAYENGANGYITKPISYEGFVDKIKLLQKYWFDTSSLPEKE